MKLTNAIRDVIVHNAVAKSGLNDARDVIVKQRAEWAEKVRLDAIGGVEVDKELGVISEKYAELLNSVPSKVRQDKGGIVRRYYVIYVNVAGISVGAYFHGGESERGLVSVWKNTPSSHTLLADNPLVAEFHEIHNKQAEYDDKLSILTNSVQAAVQKVTTVKKLLEVWPEAKELIPEEVEKQVKQLPAIKTEDLNKMIGLPS
jgi:hypothetical protein